LQKNLIAWESWQATSANVRMFKHIRTKLDEANLELGSERGRPPDAKGTGRRFSHVMAIAPNASLAVLLWVIQVRQLSLLGLMLTDRIHYLAHSLIRISS
jgi:hypothetical protein